MASFKDQCIMLTGSSRGIGATIAKHLSTLGARVTITYSSSKDSAEQVFSGTGRFRTLVITNGCNPIGIR